MVRESTSAIHDDNFCSALKHKDCSQIVFLASSPKPPAEGHGDTGMRGFTAIVAYLQPGSLYRYGTHLEIK